MITLEAGGIDPLTATTTDVTRAVRARIAHQRAGIVGQVAGIRTEVEAELTDMRSRVAAGAAALRSDLMASILGSAGIPVIEAPGAEILPFKPRGAADDRG